MGIVAGPDQVIAATLATAVTAAHQAAAARVRRHRLLPHKERLWGVVAGALKQAALYDRMIAVPRGRHESLANYTHRFAFLVQSERGRGRALLVNLHSALYDGTQHNLVEALAIPHLQTTCILGLTGVCRVVGTAEGVAVVSEALRKAGLPFFVQTS